MRLYRQTLETKSELKTTECEWPPRMICMSSVFWMRGGVNGCAEAITLISKRVSAFISGRNILIRFPRGHSLQGELIKVKVDGYLRWNVKSRSMVCFRLSEMLFNLKFRGRKVRKERKKSFAAFCSHVCWQQPSLHNVFQLFPRRSALRRRQKYIWKVKLFLAGECKQSW